MRERLAHFRRLTEEAAEKCARISQLGVQIDHISMAVRVLAISANVEAARLPEGRAFTIIAGEMTRLAEQIEQSNDDVSGVVSHLLQILPEIGAEARDLGAQTDEVAQRMEARDETLSLGGVRLAAVLETCRKAGATRLPAMLEASQRTLDRLGFSDIVAQRLSRIEPGLKKLKARLLTRLGVPTRSSPTPAGRRPRRRAGEGRQTPPPPGHLGR